MKRNTIWWTVEVLTAIIIFGAVYTFLTFFIGATT